jgi:hypothetical protein
MSVDPTNPPADESFARANTSTYEFTPTQHQTFEILSSRMRLVGILHMFLGLGIIAYGLFFAMMATNVVAILASILIGAVPFLIGLWTFRAGSYFQQIVDTKGADTSLLMHAIDNLKRLYSFLFVLLVVAGLLIGMLWLLSSMRFLGQAIG